MTEDRRSAKASLRGIENTEILKYREAETDFMFVGAGLTAQVTLDWRGQRSQAPAYETDSKNGGLGTYQIPN